MIFVCFHHNIIFVIFCNILRPSWERKFFSHGPITRWKKPGQAKARERSLRPGQGGTDGVLKARHPHHCVGRGRFGRFAGLSGADRPRHSRDPGKEGPGRALAICVGSFSPGAGTLVG